MIKKEKDEPACEIVSSEDVPNGLLSPEAQNILATVSEKNLSPREWMKEVIELVRKATGCHRGKETNSLIMEVYRVHSKKRDEYYDEKNRRYEEMLEHLDKKIFQIEEGDTEALLTSSEHFLLSLVEDRPRVLLKEIHEIAQRTFKDKSSDEIMALARKVNSVLSKSGFEVQQDLLEPNKGLRGEARRRRDATLERLRNIEPPNQGRAGNRESSKE